MHDICYSRNMQECYNMCCAIHMYIHIYRARNTSLFVHVLMFQFSRCRCHYKMKCKRKLKWIPFWVWALLMTKMHTLCRFLTSILPKPAWEAKAAKAAAKESNRPACKRISSQFFSHGFSIFKLLVVYHPNVMELQRFSPQKPKHSRGSGGRASFSQHFARAGLARGLRSSGQPVLSRIQLALTVKSCAQEGPERPP